MKAMGVRAGLAVLGALVLGSLAFAVGTPASSQLLAKVASTKTLTIGTANDAPWSYVDSSGQLKGIIPDMLRDFLKYEGVDAQVKAITMPFSSLIPSVQSGRIQLVGDSMYKTAPRQKQIDFTDVIFYNPPALVVQKGNPQHLSTLADLCGKSAGTYEGTTYVQNLKTASSKCPAGSSIKLKVVPNVQDVIASVSSGSMDGALIDSSIAAYALHQNPKLNIELAPNFTPENKALDDNALGLKKGHGNFIADFNHWYAIRKQSGWITALFKKWGLTPTKFWLSL